MAERPLTSHLMNHLSKQTRRAIYCWRCKNPLISDVLFWISTHGDSSVGRPTKRYIHHLCADTGFRREDFSRVMTN